MVGALAAVACTPGAGTVPGPTGPEAPSAPPPPVAVAAPVATVVVGGEAPPAASAAPSASGEAGAPTLTELLAAQQSGLLEALRGTGEPGALGEIAGDTAAGSMWGDEIGDSFGAGGLGLAGTGLGGGGTGVGIGTGSVGILGHGSGLGTGAGFGSSRPVSGPPRPKGAAVRMGRVTVSGRLPPEVVQRIARLRFGAFRACYERGLVASPRLAGTVTVRFVIGADGTVSAATAETDLPDAGVASCVTRQFYGLAFPAPDGGVVKVVFPLAFAPPEATALAAPPGAPPMPPPPPPP
ncbi:MAG: AgmX/PglI C-terminal domain-containing protein [Polyangiaceae bacterium]|nr:AgmX/PglI C-terminal domain-containing protein [Polyangiaceae bacterium]